LGGRRRSRGDAVHIERTQQHVVFRQDIFRIEDGKSEQLRLGGNGREIASMVPRGSDDRDDIADLTVERGTDLVEDISKQIARRDGLKNLFFESE
jgi:hypothetical protein